VLRFSISNVYVPKSAEKFVLNQFVQFFKLITVLVFCDVVRRNDRLDSMFLNLFVPNSRYLAGCCALKFEIDRAQN
jgi:hypothetical protein